MSMQLCIKLYYQKKFINGLLYDVLDNRLDF